MKKKVQIIIKNNNFKKEHKGKIISVFRGYAFNYLIPNGLASLANKNQIKHYRMFSEIAKKEEEANSIAIKKIQSRIEQISKITIYKKIGHNKLMFGSVKEKDIINWIYKYTNIKFEKKQIQINDINNINISLINIQIKQNIVVTVKLCIMPYNN
uniref:50S ribosomal protein L9, chloroplastic n=1 Tax=Laurencia australis TaxID=3073067 RepID=A0AA51NET4_9FLOR|nr:50S ribosomal protein L9 [Laurencia australis]WMP12132.1 50S ribosomal protein L9 [Laurencia australis]